jgi:hypothetical protein
MATILGNHPSAKASKSSTAKTSTASKPASSVNYNYDARNETASQYNDRIAKERGDSAQSLASMQSKTASTFKNAGLDANQLSVPRITPQALAPTPALDIPKFQAPGDLGNLFGMNNAALADPSKGLTFQNNQFVYDPNKSEAENAVAESNATTGSQLSQLLAYLKPEEGQFERAYSDMRAQSGVDQYQRDVNTYSSQLNAIQANAEAESLGLEGQGRGVTESIIGGQQAQIRREAAIQALPVQAQLAAAQGNLQMAQQNLDTLFAIKSKDIETERNYRSTVVNSLMSWATTSQQNLLNAKLGDIQARSAEATANLGYIRDLQSQALEYGQPGLITQLANLDPKSKTFNQDVARIQSRLSKPVDTLGDAYKQAQIANIYDQIDARQADLREAKRKATTEQEKLTIEKTEKSESMLATQKLLNDVAEMPGLSSAVGFGLRKSLLGGIPFVKGDAISGTARKDFEVAATRLSDMFLVQNLDKMTGVLTDKDLEVLRNEGTTIGNFNQSESAWFAEKARLDAMLQRGIAENGLNVEQAVFWGGLEPTDIPTFNSIWETL